MIKTKALIHYFSGTGNSARVASLVANELIKSGIEPYLRSITEGCLPYRSAFNLHVLIFPTYSFTLPAIMRQYLALLPPGRGASTMLLAIHGDPGYEGRILFSATKFLSRHGYHVQLTDTIASPDSFTQCVNPPPAKEQQRIYNQASTRISLLVKRFVGGEQALKPCSFFNRLWTGAIGFLFTAIGRRFLGKMFIADEDCNRCGECVKACPAGALSLVNKPHWNYQCQACQRCINLCPQTAIQTSCFRPPILLGTVILSYLCVENAFKAGYFANFNPQYILPLFIGAWLITELIIFYLADIFLFLLELIPGVRKLLSFSYTKDFRRYIEPHFKPMNRN
jgi:ferredoxin